MNIVKKLYPFYYLDMTTKTKKLNLSLLVSLGIGGGILALGGAFLYGWGTLNPLFARELFPNGKPLVNNQTVEDLKLSQDFTQAESENLQTQGIQNRVQYLTSLVISGGDKKVEFKYDESFSGVRAVGVLNMENVIAGTDNFSNTSSVVFGGKNNRNDATNSVLAA